MFPASCLDLTDARAGVYREKAGSFQDQALTYITVVYKADSNIKSVSSVR